MLDELAEGLRGHIDAAEELAAGRFPAGAAALQDGDVGLAHAGEPVGGRGRKVVGTAIEHDDRNRAAGYQVADQEF